MKLQPLCRQEQTGCSWAEAANKTAAAPQKCRDNERKTAANSKSSQAWKRCFPPPSKKLWKEGLIKALWIVQASLSAPFGFMALITAHPFHPCRLRLPQTAMKEQLGASAKLKTPLRCCRSKESENLFSWAILRIMKCYCSVRLQFLLLIAWLFSLCILAEGHIGLNWETEHLHFDQRQRITCTVSSSQLLEKFLVPPLSPEEEPSSRRQDHSALCCHWKLLTNSGRIRFEGKVVCSGCGFVCFSSRIWIIKELVAIFCLFCLTHSISMIKNLTLAGKTCVKHALLFYLGLFYTW